ncbi:MULTISPECIES: hypothetical protein [Halomicrobium]|uniref:Uncharacterized protein n=2 Tax=Halomicrobium mukohataei TaxID=57705 RepID=C7P1T9_HALMD|nr:MULTISPECIES: hypothetical protein [Halomicrobium]ACV49179.1 hypothetical protein Hmuk_3074 [Halomicrobium mukohataei DSM 12286]QCD64585.1 hypothetical protein E5139_02620 [Halomicrobium mukohataei]QFR19392.1 hypothetical protein GBQ70_02620 [Halomicrobium sp. ZPS1]
MSETVRIRDEDYEKIEAAQEVLGLSFPEVVHLALNTDVLTESPAQNARRAIRYYYTYIVMEYDDVQDVPVEELSLDSADQAKAGLTVGAEKHENDLEKQRAADAESGD